MTRAPRRWQPVVLTGALLATAACSHPATTAADAARPSRAHTDAAVATHRDARPDVSTTPEGLLGSIEGSVTLDGPLRPGPRLTVPAAYATHAGCRDAALRYAQPFDVTTPGPMPGALVAAEAHTPAPAPARDRVLTFRDCDIVPRVLFATQTDRVVFHADSRGAHLPHIFGYGAAIDQMLIPHQDDQTHPFTHPGRYPVTARTMPDWVQSMLFILPNRFIDQTDSAGHYRIDHVPVGRVLVHAWYPGAVPAQEVVEVRAGETAHADFHVRQSPPEAPRPASDAGGLPTPG